MGFQNFLHAIYGLPGGYNNAKDTHDGWKFVRRRAREAYTDEKRQKVRRAAKLVKELQQEKFDEARVLKPSLIKKQIAELDNKKQLIQEALDALSKEIDGYLLLERLKNQFKEAKQKVLFAKQQAEEEEEFLLILMHLYD